MNVFMWRIHLIFGKRFTAWCVKRGYVKPLTPSSAREGRNWLAFEERRATTLRWAVFSAATAVASIFTSSPTPALLTWLMGIGAGGVIQAMRSERRPKLRRQSEYEGYRARQKTKE